MTILCPLLRANRSSVRSSLDFQTYDCSTHRSPVKKEPLPFIPFSTPNIYLFLPFKDLSLFGSWYKSQKGFLGLQGKVYHRPLEVYPSTRQGIKSRKIFLSGKGNRLVSDLRFLKVARLMVPIISIFNSLHGPWRHSVDLQEQ